WAYAAVALLIVLIALIAANTGSVRLDWVFGSTHASLVWIILASAVLGWLLGSSVSDAPNDQPTESCCGRREGKNRVMASAAAISPGSGLGWLLGFQVALCLLWLGQRSQARSPFARRIGQLLALLVRDTEIDRRRSLGQDTLRAL